MNRQFAMETEPEEIQLAFEFAGVIRRGEHVRAVDTQCAAQILGTCPPGVTNRSLWLAERLVPLYGGNINTTLEPLEFIR